MITCNELKSFPKKENEKQEKQGNAFKLDILLQLGVCSIIFSCLNPFDCLDFLMAYPRYLRFFLIISNRITADFFILIDFTLMKLVG